MGRGGTKDTEGDVGSTLLGLFEPAPSKSGLLRFPEMISLWFGLEICFLFSSWKLGGFSSFGSLAVS